MERLNAQTFLDLYLQEPNPHSVTACLLRHAVGEEAINVPLVIDLIDRAKPDPIDLRALGFAARQGIAAQADLDQHAESAKYARVLEDVELRLESLDSVR